MLDLALWENHPLQLESDDGAGIGLSHDLLYHNQSRVYGPRDKCERGRAPKL